MTFVSNISKATNMRELITELTVNCDGHYTLGILFITAVDKDHIRLIIEHVRKSVRIDNFMACTCAGIIGNDTELEGQVGACLFLAECPDVAVKPFYLDQENLQSLTSKEDYYKAIDIYPDESPIFLVLPDPFQIDLNRFMNGMNEAFPTSSMFGGLASGSNQADGNLLMLQGEYYRKGLVGVGLMGNIKVDAIVSQGCRPVGESYIVTKAKDNIIYEVAGQPFLDVVKKTFQGLSPEDRALAQQALLVGIVMDEYKHEFNRGDFLIRTVMGIDQPSGALVIGDSIKTGQTVQIHLRDARAAEEDLNRVLNRYKQVCPDSAPQAILVFSCNGRGSGLFKEANHDIQIIQKYLGSVPAAGFFCAGEIGPVCGQNYLHGFTDSIVVFS